MEWCDYSSYWILYLYSLGSRRNQLCILLLLHYVPLYTFPVLPKSMCNITQQFSFKSRAGAKIRNIRLPVSISINGKKLTIRRNHFSRVEWATELLFLWSQCKQTRYYTVMLRFMICTIVVTRRFTSENFLAGLYLLLLLLYLSSSYLLSIAQILCAISLNNFHSDPEQERKWNT